MTSRPTAPKPVGRAAAFGATSAILAAFAHAAGGGSLPNVWMLLLGAAFAGAATRPLLGRESRWPVIVAALAATQVFLHGWMSLLGAHHHAGGGGSFGPMLAAHVAATAAASAWLRYGEQRLWSAARLEWVRRLLGVRAFEPPLTSAAGTAAAEVRPFPLTTVFDPSARAVRGPPVALVP